LSRSEMRILRAVSMHGDGALARELAHELSIDAGQLSRMLRALPRRRLLARIRFEPDGRKKRIVVTALWKRPVLLLWLPPAFWAGNLVIGRALGEVYPPVSPAVGRWLVALAALAPFVAHAVWRDRALIAAHWRLIVACGAFGIAGYNALGYLALQTTPAANVAFINSTLPLMVPIAAAALGVERAALGEPIRAFHLAGIALILAGFIVATWRGASRGMAVPRPDAARP